MSTLYSSDSTKLTRYDHYRLFLHQAGNPATSSTFVSLSCLTDELAAAVAQSVNGITRFVFRCEPYLSYRGCVADVH